MQMAVFGMKAVLLDKAGVIDKRFRQKVNNPLKNVRYGKNAPQFAASKHQTLSKKTQDSREHGLKFQKETTDYADIAD